ncbi:hypothetical protein H072_9673 [Dactylellina haptotyla CBS 200.50]|uniref:EGF-like domain-containing protein n=1 Tax=Dactylellina haptotyla (strain CBS 200.50) TaxID=1284197 RepID=S8A257_DACHA|nr:hypothetical protein H072_9673 [Dactylellina haptotyla CBS 200.50]
MQNFSRRSFDQTRNTLDSLDEESIYEGKTTQALRVVNGGIEPRHMRKGSYIEDDNTYSAPLVSPDDYGAIPAFPVYGKSGSAPDVSRTRDTKEQSSVPDSRRTSARTGRNARRSLITGPQPQPQLSSNSQPTLQAAPKPRFPVNPSSTVEYYRQQQQQQQQFQNYTSSRQSRHLSQGLASPNLGRYSPPLEADEDAEDENMRARSIMIGFEAPSPVTNSQTTNPSFPPAQTQHLAPFPSNGGRRVSSSSTNSATAGKRGPAASSHYSQLSYVSTIPEESSDYGRHGSFASSHVIPSSWGSGVGGLWIPGSNEELMSDGASSISKGSGKSRGNDYEDFDEGTTLVRQASMGRKTKPKLTDVRAPSERSDSRSKSSKSDTTKSSSHCQTKRGSRTSLTLETKNSFKSEKGIGQAIGSPMEIADDLQPPPKLGFWQRLSSMSSRNSTADTGPKPLKLQSGKDTPEGNYMHSRKESQTPSMVSSAYGAGFVAPTAPQPSFVRPRPPRLNIDAVREAEARGSLTSLPELIRRATKLAAVLETGARPDSRWDGSRAPSIMSTDTSMHNGRYQESLSDILASFPPPMASSRRLSSRETGWPLPGDFGYLRSEETSEIKRKRKICGLPLWAFIVLILLAIIVATAAVILPVQLVALSKEKNKSSAAITPDTCAKSSPCLNGGLANVEDGKCTCVCTNQFSGPTCAESNDPACITITVQDKTGGQTVSRNVSIGLAIPRLLKIAQPQYQVPIDAATLASTFSLSNTTCALQNALINLNGRTSPIGTNPDGTTQNVGSTSSTGFALDESVIDFGRVAVIYIASTVGMKESVDARENLGTSFAAGTDYGTVEVDTGISIDLTKLRITTGGGQTVVGGPGSKSKPKLHRRSGHLDQMRGHLVRRHNKLDGIW